MYENGNAKIIPSILSNKPPCPGIILPVSLIFEILLKYEITISPIWLIVEIEIIFFILCFFEGFCSVMPEAELSVIRGYSPQSVHGCVSLPPKHGVT